MYVCIYVVHWLNMHLNTYVHVYKLMAIFLNFFAILKDQKKTGILRFQQREQLFRGLPF